MGANVDHTRNTYFIFDFNYNDDGNFDGAIVIQFPEDWPKMEAESSADDEDRNIF